MGPSEGAMPEAGQGSPMGTAHSMLVLVQWPAELFLSVLNEPRDETLLRDAMQSSRLYAAQSHCGATDTYIVRLLNNQCKRVLA